MKKLIIVAAIVLLFSLEGYSQTTDCPSGLVCIPQATANRLFQIADQLLAAQDTIAKLMAERGQSDKDLANALNIIKSWEKVEVINGQIQLKYEHAFDLFEKVIVLYDKSLDAAFKIIENLNKQLNSPKSAWGQFVSGLKSLGKILIGVGLGRLLGK